jgi:hypothetical protein
MSDHDAAPDPMDKAYAQAEAVLGDEAARAARRERVLAAVAREPASSPSVRRSGWRRGGWLAAAGIAGLSLFVAFQIYRPYSTQPQTAPPTPAVVHPATPTTAAPPPSVALPSPAPQPAPKTLTVAPPPSRPDIHPAAPPPPPPPAPPPPPPPPAAPASPPSSQAVVVTAERRASAPEANDSALLSRGARDEAVEAQGAAAPAKVGSSAGLISDQGARLRAAAAAGRTAEVKALLDRGVPVDAPDADGDTALMKSIRADHPAAAALLRRNGASLDHKNHAGESPRDMATAKGDPELNQALGLDR